MQSFTPGWNDPPSLSRDLNTPPSTTSSSVRNLLNKRVAYPIAGNASDPSQASALQASVSPAHLPPTLPPSTVAVTPASEQANHPTQPINDAAVDNAVTGSKVPSLSNEEIEIVLRETLNSCVTFSYSNKFNISKRLEKLYQSLKESSFSPPCREKLCELVSAIKEMRYVDAYNVHSAMMVNHFAEVNHWMVAVKALILECQKRTA